MRNMTLRYAPLGVLWGLCLAPSASAQEASADASASAATPDPDGTDMGPAYGADVDVATEEPAATEEPVPYMKRYRPEANTWEVGLGASVLFPSPTVHLIEGTPGYTSYADAAFGPVARIAYFPLSFLGVEAETMMAEGNVEDRGALFNAYRGHLVMQLPVASIVPFALAGIGGLAATSGPMGHDMDFAVHFGGGVKVPFSRVFSLRADFRENMSRRTDQSYGNIAFSEEVMLAGVFTLGRKPKHAAAPPAQPVDTDGDTVPDERDACPEVAALTEDGCPLDTDGDGVKDVDDYCPREAGTTENGCPDQDVDQDGVMLPCDRCPEEAGKAPDGCPIVDQDGDGILDDVDQCVDKPETDNGFEDDDGCPDEVPKEVESFTGTIDGIVFLRGSSQIARSSERGLTKAADVLKKYPSIRLEISGHTSSEGDPDFNQKLSVDRAESVRSWLVDVGGVDSDRLVARGAGFSEPVADNATAEGRAKNRRIEFKILQRGGASAAAEKEMPSTDTTAQ